MSPEIKRQRRIQGAPFEGFQFEDELTPSEWREARKIFARGKWHGAPLAELRERALGREARSTGSVTTPGFSKKLTQRPVVTAGELVFMAAAAGGAYLFGQWWGKRRKMQRARERAQQTAVHGESVNPYVVGAQVLGAIG